ncbi:hypothetical protein DN748_09865 [Sinomicrobium soli]|nr:hypothetical protein DN748_09865 [Sinomicrobium sp. N-1-3-6]
MFRRSNRVALHYAAFFSDSVALADVHWNYGGFYLQKETYDSAYYHYNKAHLLFTKIPNRYYAGKMLYNMAIIQGRLKDYTRCEVLLYDAITLMERFKKHKQLYYCFNLLGVINEEMGETDRAVSHYQTALQHLDKIEDGNSLKAHVYNNLGVLYQKQGIQDKALRYFGKAAPETVKAHNPTLYARLIDNIAYSRLLHSDTLGLYRQFLEGLAIRESLHNQSGVIVSKLHLAEYRAVSRDTTEALRLARGALNMAREIRNNEDILVALLLLSQLDIPAKSAYLQEYIRIQKYIAEQERTARNKFARIQYETDQFIKRTRQLTSQKIWILSIGVALFLLLISLYMYFRQQAKNRILRLENRRQKADEQLYILSINQQERIQKARNQERWRISENLHGGILGEVYALRLQWKLLELQGKPRDIRQHHEFLRELRQIESNIRDASHALIRSLKDHPLDFIHILEKMIISRCRAGDLDYQFADTSGIHWGMITPTIKANLYYILEEALRNTVKHARARHIVIGFTREDNTLVITYKDDGKGMRKHQKGIGLQQLKNRVRRLNGSLKIHSSPGNGTTITVITELNS